MTDFLTATIALWPVLAAVAALTGLALAADHYLTVKESR